MTGNLACRVQTANLKKKMKMERTFIWSLKKIMYSFTVDFDKDLCSKYGDFADFD